MTVGNLPENVGTDRRAHQERNEAPSKRAERPRTHGERLSSAFACEFVRSVSRQSPPSEPCQGASPEDRQSRCSRGDCVRRSSVSLQGERQAKATRPAQHCSPRPGHAVPMRLARSGFHDICSRKRLARMPKLPLPFAQPVRPRLPEQLVSHLRSLLRDSRSRS